MSIIIAVDPGQNVGMAFRFENKNWGTLTIPKVPTAEERFSLLLETLAEQITATKCDVVVVESFKTMSRYLSKYGLETIELVGAIRALCYNYEVPIVQQMPAQRTAFEADAKKLLNGRKNAYSDHEVSALAHLLFYEYREGRVLDGLKAAPTKQAVI